LIRYFWNRRLANQQPNLTIRIRFSAPFCDDSGPLLMRCVCSAPRAARERDEPTHKPAAALHAFHRTLREYRVRPETSAETLWAQLRLARLDDYQRRSAKTSREYPRKKQRQPIGIPHITRATPHQIAHAHALRHQEECEEFR
jgi:hypothetical protein